MSVETETNQKEKEKGRRRLRLGNEDVQYLLLCFRNWKMEKVTPSEMWLNLNVEKDHEFYVGYL